MRPRRSFVSGSIEDGGTTSIVSSLADAFYTYSTSHDPQCVFSLAARVMENAMDESNSFAVM